MAKWKFLNHIEYRALYANSRSSKYHPVVHRQKSDVQWTNLDIRKSKRRF